MQFESSIPLYAAGCNIPYIDYSSVKEYLQAVETNHPDLYSALDTDRVEAWARRRSADIETGFQSHGKGRGHLYRAQRATRPLSRPNVAELFRLLETASPAKVVDLLGGNGHMTRVRSLLEPSIGSKSPVIITSDLDTDQIASALSQGLPAIRQPAQDTIFKNESFDAALFAYGTHHIPPRARQSAWNEAYRILRNGGQIVVQDFEEHSPTARWYSEVLNWGTTTGHACDHFEASTLIGQLQTSGFKNIEVRYVDDSFVVDGKTEADALVTGLDHILTLFGVVKLIPDQAEESRWMKILSDLAPYFTLSENHAPYAMTSSVQVQRVESGIYRAIFPRISLVATARK